MVDQQSAPIEPAGKQLFAEGDHFALLGQGADQLEATALVEEGRRMLPYTVVKLFDLAMAPPELRAMDELQILRTTGQTDDAPLLKLWVGTRTTTARPPSDRFENGMVTGWEYFLHGWLRQGGAVAGDTVFLTWTDYSAG